EGAPQQRPEKNETGKVPVANARIVENHLPKRKRSGRNERAAQRCNKDAEAIEEKQPDFEGRPTRAVRDDCETNEEGNSAHPQGFFVAVGRGTSQCAEEGIPSYNSDESSHSGPEKTVVAGGLVVAHEGKLEAAAHEKDRKKNQGPALTSNPPEDEQERHQQNGEWAADGCQNKGEH